LQTKPGFGPKLAQPNLFRVAPFRFQAAAQHQVRGFRTSFPVFAEKNVEEAEVVDGAPAPAPEEKAPEVLLEETETVVGQKQHHSFQAETKKLLDIVTRSLYAEREVFIRELISNASDALEKFQHLELLGQDIADPGLEKEILISCDEKNGTVIIQDFGIGMSKEELAKNLGTIAHSGSLKYLTEMKDKSVSVDNIIGQFGVGFYSIFMVANEVRVYSKRASEAGSRGSVWISDGSGTYDIAEADGVARGTKIVVSLKDDAKEFGKKHMVENIIKKYSNFVGFPIKVNGERVNTIEALWCLPKSQISTEQHKLFYQFISHAYDDPLYSIHYSTDSPLNIRSLFYIPEQHTEKYGMGRMESGVNLYSRKVLIQSKSKNLLPDWLRFVKGVVDSEDLPLNVSREYLQDSALIKKVGAVLTRKILRQLEEESTKDPVIYRKFYKEFEQFLKEGVCTDFRWKDDLSKLLRFPSSKTSGDELTSFEEYVKQMQPEQKEIYYLCVPSAEHVETSPFFGAFKEKGLEVLFLYSPIDEFVMGQLGQYSDKKFVSIESAKLEKKEKASEASVPEAETSDFLAWMQKILGPRVSEVRETKLQVNAPAVVVDHEPSSYRRMMKMMDPQRAKQLPKQTLEVNTSHPVILRLNAIRNRQPELAGLVAEQVFDNALIAAGLVDDSRQMVPRLNSILEMALAEK